VERFPLGKCNFPERRIIWKEFTERVKWGNVKEASDLRNEGVRIAVLLAPESRLIGKEWFDYFEREIFEWGVSVGKIERVGG
jgi:hypothetical protein